MDRAAAPTHRRGESSRGSSRVAAMAALGAAALAFGAASATATEIDTNCPPMDLVNHNLTDYIRWSELSNRLYLENAACVTLTDIYESRLDKMGNKGPLYPFDEATMQKSENVTGSWYLEAELFVTEESRLIVQGTDQGGDCDHLLLASSPGLDGIIQVRAHGGSILIDSTHVESWDLEAGTVDEDYEDGRSYISAISEVIVDPSMICDGMAKNDMGEARLDIIDSEINHLGYYESESYGLAYKVRGFCKDLSNPELFDEVAVTGDILRSHIHHLYFGHYSYGHQGGNWSYNEVHDNNGTRSFPGPYFVSNEKGVSSSPFGGNFDDFASKRCDHVSIQNNYVHDNGHITEDGQRTGNGIMLHRSCDFSIVKNNTVHDSMDSGVALYESSSCEVSHNVLSRNKNGIRMSMGSSDNVAYENQIVINGEDEKYAIYLYRGSDEPMVEGSDGRPRRNHVYDNSLMSDDAVVMMRESDDNTIENNIIFGRVSRFKDSLNTLWIGNSVPDVHEFKVEEGSCFDPESDMDYDQGSSFSYNFDYEYEEGFFCGI
ncbi:unnamed protein product [Scytosiphon promiscuus]